MHFASANLAAFPSSSVMAPHSAPFGQASETSASFRAVSHQCIITPAHPFRTARQHPNRANVAALTSQKETAVGWEMIPKTLGPIQEPVKVRL